MLGPTCLQKSTPTNLYGDRTRDLMPSHGRMRER